MAYTSPYQKTVYIHRSPLEKNFLGINNDSWKAAARILNPPAFLLYIYFAANKDRFGLALSPKAVQKEIGMARSTFYDQLTALESLGFIVKEKGKSNIYHFYERPLGVPDIIYHPSDDVQDCFNYSPLGFDMSTCGEEYPQENIEIYNKSSPKEDKYILPKGKEDNTQDAESTPKKNPCGFDF